jgi:hypothetical protein
LPPSSGSSSSLTECEGIRILHNVRSNTSNYTALYSRKNESSLTHWHTTETLLCACEKPLNFVMPCNFFSACHRMWLTRFWSLSTPSSILQCYWHSMSKATEMKYITRSDIVHTKFLEIGKISCYIHWLMLLFFYIQCYTWYKVI